MNKWLFFIFFCPCFLQGQALEELEVLYIQQSEFLTKNTLTELLNSTLSIEKKTVLAYDIAAIDIEKNSPNTALSLLMKHSIEKSILRYPALYNQALAALLVGLHKMHEKEFASAKIALFDAVECVKKAKRYATQIEDALLFLLQEIYRTQALLERLEIVPLEAIDSHEDLLLYVDFLKKSKEELSTIELGQNSAVTNKYRAHLLKNIKEKMAIFYKKTALSIKEKKSLQEMLHFLLVEKSISVYEKKQIESPETLPLLEHLGSLLEKNSTKDPFSCLIEGYEEKNTQPIISTLLQDVQNSSLSKYTKTVLSSLEEAFEKKEPKEQLLTIYSLVQNSTFKDLIEKLLRELLLEDKKSAISKEALFIKTNALLSEEEDPQQRKLLSILQNKSLFLEVEKIYTSLFSKTSTLFFVPLFQELLSSTDIPKIKRQIPLIDDALIHSLQGNIEKYPINDVKNLVVSIQKSTHPKPFIEILLVLLDCFSYTDVPSTLQEEVQHLKKTIQKTLKLLSTKECFSNQELILVSLATTEWITKLEKEQFSLIEKNMTKVPIEEGLRKEALSILKKGKVIIEKLLFLYKKDIKDYATNITQSQHTLYLIIDAIQKIIKTSIIENIPPPQPNTDSEKNRTTSLFLPSKEEQQAMDILSEATNTKDLIQVKQQNIPQKKGLKPW